MNGLPRTLLIGLLVLTAIRLVLAAVHEISPDEAYYLMWSERLDSSYYSKGPGIAVALKLSTAIFGKTTLGVRLLAPLLALGSSLLVFRLAKGLYDERIAAWSVVILNLTPIFNAGSMIMNIDPLSVFFWLAAMRTLWLALHRANPMNTWWPVTGLLIGLGFLCKYTNALQLLSIVLLFALKRRWRPQFRRPGLYVMAGVFAVCTLPVIVWNAGHGWITVTHLGERGSLDESVGIHPSEFFEYVGMHLGVYSPFFFVGLVAALVSGTRRFFASRSDAFLVAFSLPVVVLYFLLAWREAGEANWTAPGMAGAGILLARFWPEWPIPGRRRTVLRQAALWTAALTSALMLNTDLVRGVLAWPPLERFGLRWEYRHDPLKRILGWKETADAVAGIVEAAREELGEDVFLIANRYQTAAVLNFHLPDDIPVIRPSRDHPPVHCVENPLPQNQFSFWPRYDGRWFDGAPTGEPSPFAGRTALFITDEPERDSAPSMIRRTFTEPEVTAVVDIMRRGQVLRTIKVFACFDYQPLAL